MVRHVHILVRGEIIDTLAVRVPADAPDSEAIAEAVRVALAHGLFFGVSVAEVDFAVVGRVEARRER